MKKRILAFITAMAALFGGCGTAAAPEETVTERAVETTLPHTEETTLPPETEETVAETEAPEDRGHSHIIGGGEDIFTVMIYMCGTDLETDMGAATADILEMCGASGSDKVNVLLYTGGTSEWQNNYISSGTNQIWLTVEDDIVCVEDDMGAKPMTDPDTLSEFIEYSAENFPANRNALILWDHGGGSLYGFGSDEIFGGDAMQINEIAKAVGESGVYFDFIGFDACLMATVETACALKDHADYLIASEELEPGRGWHYTGWIDAICENTSLDTVSIGTIIADDFISKSCDIELGESGTLSVTDLSEAREIFDRLNLFSKAAAEYLDNDKFSEVSRSRSDAKAFGNGDYDIIDLGDFAAKLNIPESEGLIGAIEKAVVYKVSTDDPESCCGLSVYLPFKDITSFGGMADVYRQTGFEGEYTKFARKFATLVAGGQSGHGGMSSPFEDMDGYWSGGYDFGAWEQYDWFDVEYAAEHSESYDENTYSGDLLEVEDRGEFFALALTDEDWQILTDIKMQIYYDDGEGYIDMGTDNYFEVDEDSALLVDFDGLWFAFGDMIVPFHVSTGEDGSTKGSIHCLLNGEEVDLIVFWDENGEGWVAGAQRYYSTGVSGKGLIPVNDGDMIQLICDYYTYDGEYEDNYFYADEFAYDSSMKVMYSPTAEGDYLLYYVLTDIYNNVYYTEAVTLNFDESYFIENFPEYYE